MTNTSIIISSENHANKTDFTTQFSPGIHLDPYKRYGVSLIKADMYYSWTNISASQGTNIFEYSDDSGATWKQIVFTDGLYTISEINNVLPDQIDVTGINSTQRIVINLATGYQVRFTNTEIYNLFGFNKTDLLTGKTTSPRKADLTNGITSVLVHCSLVDTSTSIRNGTFSNVLYSVSPPILPPGSLYNVVDNNGSYFLPMNTTNIESVRMWVTDQRGHNINNLGEDTVFHLLIKEIDMR
eukprot:TRINITY_DN373_c0_g1_i11.p2 TRINITY_DN373_c0_g1~~TRINITY_DN373_c0_g1_i11.p2  ORF type:complete len:241 (+),score=12.68 TRINITY_DN373_c0_g1_i11:1272-1994(+)